MAQELITYGDILSSIREKLGIQSTDALATNKIKRMINEYYLDEVVPFKRWFWLQKTTQIVHGVSYETGTADVTPSSTTVTLSISPSVGLGSFKGYRFSISDSNQVYTVATHTAGSATVVLTTAYQEVNNNAATFQLWRDRIDLPTEAKETIDIWHSQLSIPLKAVGPQGLRELEAAEPKPEGFPTHYNTWDFYDPSSGDDELESDRFRQTRIYPSINNEVVILNVDYVQEATPLDDLIDEPLMPVGDRIVLFYGALALAYSAIARDEDMHDRYQMKADRKLARMAGERDEGQDTPKLSPNTRYVNSIRRSGLKRRNRVGSGW